MPNSIATSQGTRPSLPTKRIGVGDVLRFPAVRSRAALFRRYALRAGRHRQPDGPRLCRRRSKLRRNPADLPPDADHAAATGEDAASPRLPMTLNVVLKAKGDAVDATAADHLRRDRAALARCRRLSLTGAELAAKLTGEGWPARSDRPENIDRIETNLQIAHAPKSAVRDFRTDYLLKVFDYDAQAQRLRGSAAREPDRSRPDSGRRKPRARIQGLAARSRAFQRTRSRHDADPGEIPGHRRDCADAGRIRRRRSCSRPSAWCRARAQRAPSSRESDVVAALKKAAERGVNLQNIRSVARLRAAAQRHHLFGLPPDPRHRRLSFSRRRLDGGQAFQFDRGAGVAAFLRRPGPPPRYPRRVARRPGARITRAAFPAGRNCAAAPNSPEPNMTTAGARIAICPAQSRPTTTRAFAPGPARKGSPARSSARPRGWACAS